MPKPIVHIVHHIDTEGPLCEPLNELFVRLEKTLGHPINLPPTKDSLKQLQSKDFIFINLEVNTLLKKLVDPFYLNFKTDWGELDRMLDRIMASDYRNNFKDSFGNGWVFNWHLLDHVGFETNPRFRAMGYSHVFNFYKNKIEATQSYQDSLQWHFHPIPFSKAANISATSYTNSMHELQQVVCRRLIDHNWFPVVNRAGFHTVRPDSNWWLEQWLPFDPSNQAMATDNVAFSDNINGRFGDWRGAPDDWSLYNPDWLDWRKKGNMKRTIARCLNLNTRFRNIDSTELHKAFKRAETTGKDVYVGIDNHDYREMSTEMEDFYAMLLPVANSYSNVDFAFSETISAFRKCLDYQDKDIISQKLNFDIALDNETLSIQLINGELFGPQPFLGILTKTGQYYTDNFDFGLRSDDGVNRTFYYSFDYLTIDIKNISQIAVASNDKFGNTCIKRIKL